jgi:hypothetical protein
VKDKGELLESLQDVHHVPAELCALFEELVRTESDCSSEKCGGDLVFLYGRRCNLPMSR